MNLNCELQARRIWKLWNPAAASFRRSNKREKRIWTNLISQSKKRLDQLLKLGVTTCEVKTGYGLDTETELKMLETIFELNKIHDIDLIPTFLPAHAFPKEFKEKPDEYVALICSEMLPKAKEIINYQLSII